MIKEEKYPTMGYFQIFKIRTLKFSELLKAFELNSNDQYITLFTKIEILPRNVGAIYIEKSALETAYEEFMETTEHLKQPRII